MILSNTHFTSICEGILGTHSDEAWEYGFHSEEPCILLNYDVR